MDHASRLIHPSGDFFAVDPAAFHRAAMLGLNEGVGYLVMACGTGRDNRRSTWSVKSIEKYTGISRPRAKKAVARICADGLAIVKRPELRPSYELPRASEIGGIFTAEERAFIAGLDNRKQRELRHSDRALATRLRARGYIVEASYSSKLAHERGPRWDEAHEDRLVWLPNSIVTGAAGEKSPLELVRQSRNATALRLLVDLYGAQYLPAYHGVPRSALQWKYERHEIGQRGQFRIFGFKPISTVTAGMDLVAKYRSGIIGTDGRDPDFELYFWPGFYTLRDTGIIQQVGVLLEGDDDEAEIMHAVSGAEDIERAVGAAAQEAGLSMLTEAQIERAASLGIERVVPVLRHMNNVSMSGIYRLRYRPRTSVTAAWWAEMQEQGEYWLRYYREIAASNREGSARVVA